MKTCAVIPAAGLGTRLKMDIPKLLAPLTQTKTIWSVLRRKLLPIVDHIHLVVSPIGEPLIREVVTNDEVSGLVSLSIQPKPIGMGDAIFQGYPIWSQAKTVLVIWGDQVFVSHKTLARSLELHAQAAKTVSLPIVRQPAPYVEYMFDKSSRLVQVKQSREGDKCSPNGFSDVGTFVLSVDDLLPEWQKYLSQTQLGSTTGEVNFLPFLPFLSTQGWHVHPVHVTDVTEARGINTPDDLVFFQNLYKEA